MEAETIIYYHPVPEQTHTNCAAKRHWWQNAVLQERFLPEKIPAATDSGLALHLVDCPIPPYYYKTKKWKPEELSECMEAVLHRTSGMADSYLHPEVMTWMSQECAARWEICRETMEKLTAGLLSIYGDSHLRQQGKMTVLLGAPDDTEWQMEMTWRFLEPYLARINNLWLYYEERQGADIWEELAPHLERYYYEYGLVPQLIPYETKGMRNRGGRRCEGVILDYGTAHTARIGSAEETIYVDMTSSLPKQQAFARTSGQILYVSPLKYLDTMVKNSYDRLVR